MANPVATANEWKKKIKNRPKVEESALLTRALEDYEDKVKDQRDGDEVAAALKKVVDRAKAAKKDNGNKDLAGFLNELIGDALKQMKVVTAPKEEEEDEDDENIEAGAKLRLQLRQAKTLDADKARPFVLALGQVAGLVIVKRPPVTKDHRNVARQMRTGKGKLLTGLCFGEGGKYIFQFEDKPPGGLTKVIKKAAKVHAKMEIAIKVRGGGLEIDDESDTAELTDFGDETAQGAATGSIPPTAPPKPTDEATRFTQRAKLIKTRLDELAERSPVQAAPLLTEYRTALKEAQARRFPDGIAVLTALAPRIGEALRNVPAAPQAPPSAGDGLAAFKGRVKLIKERVDDLKGLSPVQHAALSRRLLGALKLAQQDTPQALGVLDDVEEVLKGLSASAFGDATPTEKEKATPKVSYAKARLAWEKARNEVKADVGRLQTAIRARASGDPNRAAIEAAAAAIGDFLKVLDDRLDVALDRALSAADPDARKAANAAAVTAIDSYISEVDTDRVRSIDDNPYLTINVHGRLTGLLRRLRQRLV